MESGNSDGGDGYPTDHLQKSVEIDSEVMDEDREAASYQDEKSNGKQSSFREKTQGKESVFSQILFEETSQMKEDGGRTTQSTVVVRAPNTQDEKKFQMTRSKNYKR